MDLTCIMNCFISMILWVLAFTVLFPYRYKVGWGGGSFGIIGFNGYCGPYGHLRYYLCWSHGV